MNSLEPNNFLFRRMRRTENLRHLISENKVYLDDLCHPVFVRNDICSKKEVENMPEVYYYSIEGAINEIKSVADLGVKHFVVRPRPTADIVDNISKSIAFEADAIEKIRKACPNVTIMLDGYFGMAKTSGYYGTVNSDGTVNLEASLKELADHAVAQANAGADMIVSLGRLDNSVSTIRNALNENGLYNVGILSYGANFASTLAHAMLDGTAMASNYIRQSIESKIGVENINEAMRQVELEISQGADMIGVKPATIFLDVIAEVRRRYNMPIATYIVSKEYVMVKGAAMNGWINERDTVMEYMLSMKRAGATKIFNYWVKDLAKWLK